MSYFIVARLGMALQLLLLLLLLSCSLVTAEKYKPEWDSLDSRPLPGWYDDVKFGIFCHWGVYSVPAFKSEWFWWYWQGDKPSVDVLQYVEQNYPPKTTYADFAHDFKAELFDASQFRDVVEASGAKYFVITSKHHEGFTLWKSKTSWNWNAVDVGPKRDILGELKAAFTNSSVHFGTYFSLLDWFHPLYISNKTQYVQEVMYPQLLELVTKYTPEVIWSDGDWGTSDEEWRSKEFLAWLYNQSPVRDVVAVNDRWGTDIMGKHGGFMTYSDHYDPGFLLKRKWENCMTLDKKSWGNRRGMTSQDVYDAHELIEQLARTVSCGGNYLLNIGPDNHGHIPAIFEARLRELGDFLRPNAVALYGTGPAPVQNDTSDTWYTKRKSANGTSTLYAWILNTTADFVVLKMIRPQNHTRVTVLATGDNVIWQPVSLAGEVAGGLRIELKSIPWRKLPRTDVVVLAITEPTMVTGKESRAWQKYFMKWLRHHQKPRGIGEASQR